MLRKASWALAVIVASVAGGLGAVAIVSLATGCAANKAHLANETESTQAAGDYAACTLKIKAQDGGAFRDWEKCACEVDTIHHVDSGKCP